MQLVNQCVIGEKVYSWRISVLLARRCTAGESVCYWCSEGTHSAPPTLGMCLHPNFEVTDSIPFQGTQTRETSESI